MAIVHRFAKVSLVSAWLFGACGATTTPTAPTAEVPGKDEQAFEAPPTPDDPGLPQEQPETEPFEFPQWSATESASIGSPTTGRLSGSVALPMEGPGWRFSPLKDPDRRYGTVELVGAIMRAAHAVHLDQPDHPLTVGDISAREGGPISGHASHRAGRDVDIYFYLREADTGAPYPAKAIPIEPDGTGHDYGDLTTREDDVKVEIDLERTWAFVEALVGDERNRINRIFLVEHLRSMLLEHAERIGAPQTVRERFGHLTCQPGPPHDDHFHIRFFCSNEDIAEGCEDTRPYYPWHLAELRAAGLRLKPASLAKRPAKTETKTVSQAAAKKRAEVGAFHPDVDAFLARQASWRKKPKVGRPYCR